MIRTPPLASPTTNTTSSTATKPTTATSTTATAQANAVAPHVPAHDAFGKGVAGAANELKGDAVAPKKAECPHRTGAEKAEAAKKIPCPALSAMFTSDMLPVAADGKVQIADLDKALTELGLSRGVRALLTHGAETVDPAKGEFDLFNLNGSSLDHTGSSGIRQNGVHPERFELLTKFSKDGKTLTPSDLADAAKHFAKENPGARGAITQIAEMAILLETFGQRDDKGRPFFAIDDLKKLWVDGELPNTWQRPALPGSVRVDEILARVAKMKMSQIF